MFNFNLDLITPEFFYEKKTSSSPNIKRETENIGAIIKSILFSTKTFF